MRRKMMLCHRQFWRQTYDAAWRRAFKRFTGKAVTKDIQIIAGISPGLDFDFASSDQADAAAEISPFCWIRR